MTLEDEFKGRFSHFNVFWVCQFITLVKDSRHAEVFRELIGA